MFHFCVRSDSKLSNLRHWTALHVWTSMARPWQPISPMKPLRHCRVLERTPELHVVEQEDHSDHGSNVAKIFHDDKSTRLPWPGFKILGLGYKTHGRLVFHIVSCGIVPPNRNQPGRRFRCGICVRTSQYRRHTWLSTSWNRCNLRQTLNNG